MTRSLFSACTRGRFGVSGSGPCTLLVSSKEKDMKAQVTLRSGEDQETVSTFGRPPEVGSTVMHKGKPWLVTSCEYRLSHRITPFAMIIPSSRAGGVS